MLSEFLARTSTPGFEEDGWLRFVSVEWTDRRVTLAVTLEGPDLPLERWRVICSDVRACRFSGERTGSVELLSQHPLLWPHAEPHADLYFFGKAENPNAVVGQLAEAQYELVGEWFAFDRFVNKLVRSPRLLLASGSGLLASGPLPLIQKFKAILEQSGVNCSTITRTPKFWDGEKWLENFEELEVLVAGNSFVVLSKIEVYKT